MRGIFDGSFFILIFLESKESGQILRSRKILSTCNQLRTNVSVFIGCIMFDIVWCLIESERRQFMFSLE